MMDIDPPWRPRGSARLSGLPSPPGTPFDLDAYAAQYQGRKRVERLNFVAESCPSLSLDAYAASLDTIKASTLDISMYRHALNGYNAAAAGKGKPRMRSDEAWLAETRKTADGLSDQLEVEVKSQLNNLTKESIRLSYRQLGSHQYRTGDLQGAIRSHVKSRDYCTSTTHIIELCLSVIEVALEVGNYAFVRNYVMKAEAALESAAPTKEEKGEAAAKSKNAQVHMPGMVQGPSGIDAKEKERLRTQERLHVASGVAFLGQSQYLKAARSLLQVTREAGANSGVEGLIAPGDIALYATLCALAFFERDELKRRVINNPDLRPLLEFEPHLKEVVHAFGENNYKQALETLDRFSPRYQLDIHLSSHVTNLMQLIRSRALIQYFSLFSSVTLSRMSAAFGYTPTYTSELILALIQSNQLQARIDTEKQTVVAYNPDQRVKLFRRALEVGEEMEKDQAMALLRLRLVERDVLVKDGSGGGKGKGVGVGKVNTVWEEPS